MIPIARTEVSHSTDDAWTDVDVTAYVDAGNTAGVVLEIVNPTGTEYVWGVRKNGSTDDITGVIEDNGHTWAVVGVDSNDIFELYLNDASQVDVYLVACVHNDEGSFLTDASDVTPVTAEAWTDVDISTITGAETATFAFLVIYNYPSNNFVGVRKNGSTDDRHASNQLEGDLRGYMIGVDNAEKFEAWVEDKDQVTVYLFGWLTAGVSTWANGKDYSTGTTGSWVDVDVSSDVPAGNTGAFFHLWGGNSEYAGGIRQNGTSITNNFDITNQQFCWVELDAARIAEQWVESTSLDLYLLGYTSSPVGVMPAAMNHYRRRRT